MTLTKLRKDLPDEQWEKAGYILMSKFNEMDIDKLKSMPLSTFMELRKLIEWENKELERARK